MTSKESEDQYEAQSQHVMKWLKTKYTNEIPPFEVNPTTISLLYQLSQKNQQRNKEMKVLIQDAQQKQEEYKAGSQYFSNILEDSFGLGDISSHNSTTMGNLNNVVKSLAALSVELEMKDTELSSYYIRINDFLNECGESKELIKQQQKLLNGLRQKTTEALTRYNQLQKSAMLFEEQRQSQEKVLENRKRNLEYLESKSEEYKETLQKFEENLKLSGNLTGIEHSTLVKLGKELADLTKTLESKIATLHSYHQLPPDISLARIKLEEARNKFFQLEEQLDRNLNELMRS